MSVKEVNPLHSRYIELTARFKACWTFQRSHDGLQRFFGRQDLGAETYDFQSLYKRLRHASLALGSSGPPSEVDADLDRVAASLNEVTESLDRRDRRVSPSLLRLFFQRVKTFDERLLIEMIRFYQEAQRDRTWSSDRIDKVDFLVSRLAETIAGPGLTGDAKRLQKVLLRLSENAGLDAPDPAKVENRLKLVRTVRAEMRGVSSLERLEQLGLVGHYRDLKHSLGRLYFEPRLLQMIVGTNAALSTLVDGLWRREEEAIFSDYERIADLERAGTMPGELLDAVNRLHDRVGGFRRQMSTGNMRLSELAELREALHQIDSLIAAGAASVAEPPGISDAGRATRLLERDLPGLLSTQAREQIGPSLREMLDALTVSDPAADPSEVVSEPTLLRFHLSAREVSAFRRLAGGGPFDMELEEFLLAAAALRHSLSTEMAAIHGTLSRSPQDLDRVLEGTRSLLRLADRYLKQFSHFLEVQLLDPGAEGARGIQECRMQLMRDLSALWLEAERMTPQGED
ncbi:MAG: hypothetical protein R3325_07235 [Thermoanaerobaculia bacterium]|nr:hypothetical protein [Thermoanaerobaculia bacterium]